MGLNVENSTQRDYKTYYSECLEEAVEYQDWVMDLLQRCRGIHIQNYGSKKYQQLYGENRAGWEIKYDREFQKTGNLYIETAEKSSPGNHAYVESGIYRPITFLLIGNFSICFLFSVKKLRRFDKWETHDGFQKLVHVENSTKTSLGFLLPESLAVQQAEEVLREE